MCYKVFPGAAAWSPICAPQAYQNYVKTVVTRRNTITGVLYRDDPTILAIELAANPHTRYGTTWRVCVPLLIQTACCKPARKRNRFVCFSASLWHMKA